MDFNEVFDKAKDGFDVVCRKTENVVNVSKLKIEQATLESKLSKDYEKLGKLCYLSIRDGNEISELDADEIVSQISEKIESIAELELKLENMKNKKLCPACKKYVDLKATFCSFCGERLD